MQKLLKRTTTAERQVARRLTKRKQLVERAEERVEFRKRMQAYAIVNKMRIAARKNQREDWALGPLAPRRDTHIKNDLGAYWGSTPEQLIMSEYGERQIELACEWAGGKKYLCIKAGDRVAIMEGPDKGKIATIRSVIVEKGCVALDGELMQRNHTISELFHIAQPDSKPVQLAPLEVPIQAIRLVHPIEDPQTGRLRDVLIKQLRPVSIHCDKPTGRVTWSREVPGLNIEIPWPRNFEEQERRELEEQHEDWPCDTLRIDVEETTFVPTLLRPPMPLGIIDELRNRYSKFRTRHEPEYIEKKQAEERAKLIARGRTPPAMRTPLEELNAKIRRERRARGQPELTDAMLVRIGKIMAQEDERRFGGRAVQRLEKEMAPKTTKPLPEKASTSTATAPPERAYWLEKRRAHLS